MLKTVRVPEKFAPLFESAQTYVARYFEAQKSLPERGTLEISDQRYVLVRAASMSVEFYDMVRSFYGEEAEARAVAHALLFDVAHAMGLSDAKAFSERMQVSDPIARLSAGPVHFAYAGWAFVDISEQSHPTPDDDYYLLYDHPYSFESDSWLSADRPSDCPVCVMNAGYSSGWCEKSFGVRLVAVEILCRAKGDSTCRFIMAPPERIAGHINAYVRQNPDLAARIVNYKIPGFFSNRTDRELFLKNLELERRAEQRARDLLAINEQLERDIAERKRAEAALESTRELNDRLVEALPGGVVYVGVDGSLLRTNAEALRILGLGPEMPTHLHVGDFRGTTVFEDGSPADPEDYPVTRALQTGQPQPATVLGLRRPQGDLVWAVFRAVPTRDPHSHEINGAVVTFLDITERKRFEDKLRHAQKLESLGVLAGGVAHDFNNLLVSILGNASIAKNSPGIDPRMLPLLDEIETGARRAAELTKQMLDYAGHGKFKIRSVDLPALVREMAKLVKALIPKHVELHYQFQEGLPSVEADPTQLRQVIMNLITNAAESMEATGGRVVVRVEQRYVAQEELDTFESNGAKPGAYIFMEVSDTGTGMSEETRARVFDPFFTTKFTGRGLGMAAVLGIVRSHRAAIRIESQVGVGTRVLVLLPPTHRVDTVHPSDLAGARGTVLVVDDDDGVRSLVRRALGEQGFRVLAAVNGAEGLRVYEQHRDTIKLIVLDVTMPEMNGFEVVRRLRDSGSRVPILLSSGYDVDDADVDRRELNGVLEKPYDLPQLLDAVERALG
ncbi:MAG: ATP-binding protein [Myxococcota bacterium]